MKITRLVLGWLLGLLGLLGLLVPCCCVGAAPLIDLPQFPQIDEATRSSATPFRTLAARRRAGARRRRTGLRALLRRCSSGCSRGSPAAAREQGEAARAIPWNLVVTTTRGESAMSLPGGHIVISEDMISRLGLSEAEVAFVIAHEAAHLLLGHEAETLDYLQATLLPHGVKRTVWDLYAELDYDAGAMLRIESVMQQTEMEADYAGMLLGARAGYAPAQMLSALKKIDAGARRGNAIVHTHPAMLQRLQQLAKLLPIAEREREVAARH